jgi:hypothetical protein
LQVDLRLAARAEFAERIRRTAFRPKGRVVPPRKRQKPSGLTGMIADAIADRQKAAETSRRLEAPGRGRLGGRRGKD